MSWDFIIQSILGALLVGDIVMHALFKFRRRIDNADADIRETQAETEEWHRYKEELDRYDSIIKSLQGTLQTQIDQNSALVKDHAIERGELEVRFNNQTDRLREVQRDLVTTNEQLRQSKEQEINYVKRIGELELELEKKRCDDLPCPFRLPPNAHTQQVNGITKEEYVNKREINGNKPDIHKKRVAV